VKWIGHGVLLILLALGEVAQAGQDPIERLAQEGAIVTARWRQGPLPADPERAEWRGIEAAQVRLYPQSSVKPGSAAQEPMKLDVRAFYNGKELALRLEWADGGRSAAHDIGRFPDAVAVQWPVRYGVGMRLPYVGMGHEGHAVALWLWRADGRAETLAAEGFGSLTPQPSDGVIARSVWDRGRWKVVFKRSLAAPQGAFVRLEPASAGLVPLAFAVWNGEAGQRDGDKFLSSWLFLHFQRGKVDPEYAKSLVWDPKVKGSPEAGKALMTTKGCMACHAHPGNPIPAEVGPDLTWAGAIHRPEYLLESIREPSAVIAPHRSFRAVAEGKQVSTMPKLDLSAEELLHLVEYLRALGSEGK
jgi:complex iron-sulfur molybdoenzyme family reductase subunit gamma